MRKLKDSTSLRNFGALSLSVSALMMTASLPAVASIPKVKAIVPDGKAALMTSTREALSLPFESRIARLRNQGAQGYRNLAHIMMNEEMPMETRWRSVTALGRIGGKESLPELEQALKHRQWYMRNAGLVAITNIDRTVALKWAHKLSSDKALIVRMAAVDTMKSLKDRTSTPLLWQKLAAKENFKGKSSLFIRRRIVEALAELETGNEARFMTLLSDKDVSIHGPAIAGLERITSLRLGSSSDNTETKRKFWMTWWDGKQNAKAGTAAGAPASTMTR